MKIKNGFQIVAAALIVYWGCAPVGFARDGKSSKGGENEQEIAKRRGELVSAPEKPELWRKLGVACFKADSLDGALEALTKANMLDPNDAASVAYLGMIHEKKGEFTQAKNLYLDYLAFNKGDRLTQEIRYRVRWIEDQQLQQVVKDAINNEKDVKVAEIPKNAVAVIRFDAGSLPAQLRPLGRGIAELIYTDLSYIRDLKLVERLELPRLQKELKMSLSDFTDKVHAPQVGKIVGAAKIVTGRLTESDGGGINMDCGIIDVGPGLAEYPGVQQGKVSEFFTMQKKLALSIIEKLGYQVTPAIKNQIDKSPTESFLALIAYSRGLDYADQGLYPLAEAEFKAAVGEDPHFALAKQSLDKFTGLTNYDGTLKPLDQVTGLAETEPSVAARPGDARGDLIRRLQNAVRGPVASEDTPYTTPQTSAGKVIITGRTER